MQDPMSSCCKTFGCDSVGKASLMSICDSGAWFRISVTRDVRGISGRLLRRAGQLLLLSTLLALVSLIATRSSWGYLFLVFPLVVGLAYSAASSATKLPSSRT